MGSTETYILLIFSFFFFFLPLLSKTNKQQTNFALFLGFPLPGEARSHLHSAFRMGLPVRPADFGLFINCVATYRAVTAGWEAGLPDLANKFMDTELNLNFR